MNGEVDDSYSTIISASVLLNVYLKYHSAGKATSSTM